MNGFSLPRNIIEDPKNHQFNDDAQLSVIDMAYADER